MNNQEIILNKLTELFMSKNKVMTPATAKVWVTLLTSKFPLDAILKAIDKMIWQADDFPTLGKVADNINNNIKELAEDIFSKWLLNCQPKCDNPAMSILRRTNKNGLELNPTAQNRVKDRFIKQFMENDDTNLLEDDTKKIGVE